MAAPDFYFAINATFRWLHDNWGEAGLRAYWESLGREHYAELAEEFRRDGLGAVARHWREFFTGEPGGEVEVRERADRVEIEVRVCPAIKHLREHGREVMPLYCEHCRVVSQAMCDSAGVTVEVTGGGGCCSQTFRREAAA